MRIASSSAAQGIRNAERRFEQAAGDISRSTTAASNVRNEESARRVEATAAAASTEPTGATARPDVPSGASIELSEVAPSTMDVLAAETNPDLAASFVSMSQAKASFAANVAVLTTAAETERSLVDTVG